MDLEGRLKELKRSGDTEMAMSLAKGVIQSQSIEDIELTTDGVKVTLGDFTGRHATSPSGAEIKADGVTVDELAIDAGVYTFQSETVELRVELSHGMTDEIKKWILDSYGKPSEDAHVHRQFQIRHQKQSQNTESTEQTESAEAEDTSETGDSRVTDGGESNERDRRDESYLAGFISVLRRGSGL